MATPRPDTPPIATATAGGSGLLWQFGVALIGGVILFGIPCTCVLSWWARRRLAAIQRAIDVEAAGGAFDFPGRAAGSGSPIPGGGNSPSRAGGNHVIRKENIDEYFPARPYRKQKERRQNKRGLLGPKVGNNKLEPEMRMAKQEVEAKGGDLSEMVLPVTAESGGFQDARDVAAATPLRDDCPQPHHHRLPLSQCISTTTLIEPDQPPLQMQNPPPTRRLSSLTATSSTTTRSSTSNSSTMSYPYPSDTCPICIEPFVEGEPIRELVPCRHYFHGACIETWLTERRGVCPMCRADLVDAVKGEGPDEEGEGGDVERAE
ncbi:uncharacterized protein EV422DRAFT_350629 [Fimicolochytrium jonesii]|uniref:uncharacterized protein n=1 Tax=Fimicolochytrium jonesii TaxID=1396493 RepID=UPI0022FEE5DA|nr:uncharacterized protein EV422DRAFT_350629 [Fimicolochytrium jonesii]KAI8823345.1 hypothetical protein EV422DRAFT_350629 [Fimicolochytrium jonesii]